MNNGSRALLVVVGSAFVRLLYFGCLILNVPNTQFAGIFSLAAMMGD